MLLPITWSKSGRVKDLCIIIITLSYMYYMYNIIGDELLLNFGSENSPIYNFTREITKLPWQPSVRPGTKMVTKF